MNAFLAFLGLVDRIAPVSQARINHAAMSSEERANRRLWNSNASQFR